MPYECDRCGLCCTKLIIEIDELDVIREPRIMAHAEPFRTFDGLILVDDYDDEREEVVPGWGAGGMLVCGKTRQCFALGAGNVCGIYSTRPGVCVAFQAGSEKCQELRSAHGLEQLQLSRRLPLVMI